MSVYFEDAWLTIRHGDVRSELAELPADSVHCVVTSPPYWGLRDYGTATWIGGDEGCDHMAGAGGHLRDSVASTRGGANKVAEAQAIPYKGRCGKCGAIREDNQLGLEPTPEAYVANMVEVFREVRRVLRPDGLLWLNLGDSYAGNPGGPQGSTGDRASRSFTGTMSGPQRVPTGLKAKDLVGIPWRVALALQADGWFLRSDVIWHKPNPMPESVGDRPTKAHEYLFMLAKSARYFYDAEAIREPATSGPSDLRKMAEQRDRIGGKNLFSEDDHLAASSKTRIGRKRAVGGRPMKRPAGWNDGSTELDRLGRYKQPDRRWPRGWANGEERSHVELDGRFEPPEGYEYQPQAGRSKRSVWTIATEPYKGAHFATFPRKLVEPPILASTSERGVCSSCGAPWLRIVELETLGRVDNGSVDAFVDLNNGRAGETASETIGWRPGCDHGGDPIPATVLDPFAGSGTTLVVAQQLSRRAIGIDISVEYLEQLARRNRAVPLGL